MRDLLTRPPHLARSRPRSVRFTQAIEQPPEVHAEQYRSSRWTEGCYYTVSDCAEPSRYAQ